MQCTNTVISECTIGLTIFRANEISERTKIEAQGRGVSACTVFRIHSIDTLVD